MIPIKSIINSFFLIAVMVMMGCVAKDSPEVTSAPQVVNRVIASNISPADFQARTQSIITLDYTSLDNELATSCTLSHLTNVTVTQACMCDGVGVCNVGVKGVGAYSGPGSFSYNVVAGGKTSTTGKAVFNITAPAVGTNIPPTIQAIDPKTTIESTTISGITFTVGDADSTVTCANVTIASSNTAIVPLANISKFGAGQSCSLTITPVANMVGSSNITLTLTDTGTPLPAQTATSSFTLNVTAFNTPPTISSITTQATNEDISLTPVAFTIADADSTVLCSNVTATSSNTALVSNSNISITGAGQSCSITLTPNLNQSGTSTITLTVTDNGMPLPAKTATSTFTLNVAAVNDPPIVATIATQNTTEDVAKAVSFTITDVDSTLSCTSSVAVTSSNTTLVPNTNIALSGIAPNCVATVTPANGQAGTASLTVTVSDNGFPMPIQTSNTSFNFMVAQVNHAPTIAVITNKTTNEDTATSAIPFIVGDSDSTIYCSNVTPTSSNTTLVPNGNIVVSGTAPNCTVTITPVANGYGSATITLTLNDNGTPMPAMTATSIFNLTVTPVNDAPLMPAIANKTTAEGTASAAIAFTITDVDSTLSCTSGVAMTSSNTTLIPNANVVFSGTAPACSAIVTPAATGYGTATLTFTVTDNGTPLPALTAARSFTMTVTQVNHAPTITAITAQSTDEDTATGLIAFTIADTDSTVFCSNVVGTSTNTLLVPNANIVITGTAPNCSAKITPAANASGIAGITLTITDNGTPLPAMTATSAFNLTVNAVNDAPTISAITNKTTDEDTPTSAIAFTINDIDSTLNCASSVTKSSSNTTLVPNANIVITGTAPNCSAVITPAANASGNSTITLTLTDNGTPTPALTATSAFSLSVAAVIDLGGSLPLTNLSGIVNSYTGNTYGRTLSLAGLTSDETVAGVEICLGTASGSCDKSSWVDVSTYTPTGSAPSISLSGTYTLKSDVGGAQNFTLTPTCDSTVHQYFYSIRLTSNSSKVSNIVSTPAWTFWEPKCISTLTQWLDASETTTMTIATGISEWADKSSQGNNVLANATRPTLSPNGINTGYPGVTFSGSNSFYRTAFAYAQGSATFFAVIKGAANGGRYLFSEGRNNFSTSNFYGPMLSNAGNLSGAITNDSGAVLTTQATAALVLNNAVHLAMSEDTGSKFSVYSDGVKSATAPTYTRGTNTLDMYRLGCLYRTGATASCFTGNIGEFIITNGTLSADERQKLEGYSAHKWGVTGVLNVSHPYKTSPP